MKNQSLLQQKLLDKVFVYTAETTPPDASDKETLLKNVMPLKGVADAVNVTDSPGAKAHMSSLTASIILAQNGIDPILQLTVRDRNRLALQGDLIGASALGVNNILCLGGDDPKNGDQPETKIVNDIDSLTLVSTANMMRKEKKFPSGRTIDPSPKLFIGGAEVPTSGNTYLMKGRDIRSGTPKEISLKEEDTAEALKPVLTQILGGIKDALEKTPPELSADLVDMGLVLTGGGALLKNIDKLITKETGLPVVIAEDPLSCVAIGTGKALDQEETFSNMLVN